MSLPFFTIGHSNRSAAAFVALLTEAEVALVADIRKFPRSRSNPQFNEDTLPRTLATHDIAYQHLAALGGRRGKARESSPSDNAFWTNESFHNYADYALSAEFRDGLQQLIEKGHETRCAMMCAEAVWWRCHRRIVTDHLIARGEAVFHIMGPGRIEPARLTSGAVIQEGEVVYPAVPGAAPPAP